MRYDAATALRTDTTIYCERPDKWTPRHDHRLNRADTMEKARKECLILDALRDGPKSLTELAEITGVKKRTAQRLLNENASMDEPNVRTWRDPDDALRWLYALT